MELRILSIIPVLLQVHVPPKMQEKIFYISFTHFLFLSPSLSPLFLSNPSSLSAISSLVSPFFLPLSSLKRFLHLCPSSFIPLYVPILPSFLSRILQIVS
jgi:hypothetical protein